MDDFNKWFEFAPMLFPLLVWFGTFFLIGQVSGWKKFAELYPGRDISFHGKQTFKRQSAKIGGTKYNNALTVHTTIEGMQFEVPWIFRFNHPSFFIPWSMITDMKSEKFLGTKYLEISIQQINKTITMNQKIVDNNHTVPQQITDKLLNRMI